MRYLYSLLLIMGVVLSTALSSVERNKVTISISSKTGELSLSGDSNRVDICIHNGCDSVIQFYDNRTALGYDNFSFELVTPDSVFQIRHAFKLWWHSIPETLKIEPDSSLNLSFYLIDSLHKPEYSHYAKWVGMPEKTYQNAKIRIVYHVDAARASLIRRINYRDSDYRDLNDTTAIYYSDDQTTDIKKETVFHTDLFSDFMPIKIVP